MSFIKALFWSLFWIALSLLCGVVIYLIYGQTLALQFLTGYTIEKALSVDNLFLFLMLFAHFKVPPDMQRKILNYGILGVIVLRGVLIFAGIELIERFEWIMYVFGIIVIYTGFVMIFARDNDKFDAERNRIVRFARKILPVSTKGHGEDFFHKIAGKTFVTPYFLVLVVVELTDLVFAVDSIPAIFSITRDPLIVFSSNILAVLGLRSLYFLLERVHDMFAYVKKGVGIILWFVGVKMLLPLINPGFHINELISLGVILGVLALSIFFSVMARSQKAEA